MRVSVTPFCESYCCVRQRLYACILDPNNFTSDFLFKVSEAKEGGWSVLCRKYPILETDGIDYSITR